MFGVHVFFGHASSMEGIWHDMNVMAMPLAIATTATIATTISETRAMMLLVLAVMVLLLIIAPVLASLSI